MIKGWKNNPEWIRLDLEKKAQYLERRIARLQYEHRLDMLDAQIKQMINSSEASKHPICVAA